MSKTHRLTKGKLLTIGAVLFAMGVATSTVATRAWYALIEIAAVGNLNLQIDMSDAWLRLGLVKEDGSVVFNNDGFTQEELGIENAVLTDVSGMYEDEWLYGADLSTAYPKFHTRYKPGMTTTNPGFEPLENKNKTYVQNEFVLEAGMNCEIYLDPSSYIQASTEKNKITADGDSNREKALNEVVHAVRISFLTDEGYMVVNPGESVETYFGGTLDLNKDGYYDNDGSKEYFFGEYVENQLTYSAGETNETSDEYKDNHNTFIANHKKDVQKANVAKEFIKKENAYPIRSLKYEQDNQLKDTYPICHVKKGESKRIVVSIYVEGWDLHMTDDIASACFNANITFTGLIKD